MGPPKAKPSTSAYGGLIKRYHHRQSSTIQTRRPAAGSNSRALRVLPRPLAGQVLSVDPARRIA